MNARGPGPFDMMEFTLCAILLALSMVALIVLLYPVVS